MPKKFSISLLLFLVSGIIAKGQVEPPYVNDWYEISTLNHLCWVSENPSSWNKNFKLTNDIDAADTKYWNIDDHDGNSTTPDSARGWSPIGNFYTKFTGKFDGKGYKIDSLYINRTMEANIVFFEAIEGSEITNLALTNIYINGRTDVGAFVGTIRSGAITNCYCTGNVCALKTVGGLVGYNISGIISDCYSTGSVRGKGNFVGGLIGINFAEVRNCYFSGHVFGDGKYVGGLIGSSATDSVNRGTVSNCYSTGSVTGKGDFVGGLIGINKRSVSDCYSTGCVNGSDRHVGGLVGAIVGGWVGDNYDGTIVNCFCTGNVNGNSDVGGLVGNIFNGTVSNSYSTGSVTGFDNNVGGLVGSNFSGTVSNSFSIGSVDGGFGVVGGFVGLNSNGALNNCYSSGNVNGNFNVGGFVGTNNNGTISHCYSMGKVIGTGNNIGGLVGSDYSGLVSYSFWDTQTSGKTTSAGGIGKTSDEMKSKSTFTNIGWDFINIWNINSKVNNGYPNFKNLTK